MAIRISEVYLVNVFLWILIAILQLSTQLIQRTYLLLFYVGIGLMIVGVSFGLGIGIILSRRWLFSLEEKGEVQFSLSKTLISIGLVLVFGGIMFLFMGQIPLEMLTAFFDFLAPSIPAFFATIVFLFRGWEKKHSKIILQGTWGGKFYVSPYP